MLDGLIGNAALGAGLKIAGSVIGQTFETWRHYRSARQAERLAELDRRLEQESVRFGGDDTADDWTRGTRRVLAFLFGFTFSTVVVYCALVPGLVWRIPVEFAGGLFSWITGERSQTTLEITSGAIVWSYVEFMFLVGGFYFTKIGTRS